MRELSESDGDSAQEQGTQALAVPGVLHLAVDAYVSAGLDLALAADRLGRELGCPVSLVTMQSHLDRVPIEYFNDCLMRMERVTNIKWKEAARFRLETQDIQSAHVVDAKRAGDAFTNGHAPQPHLTQINNYSARDGSQDGNASGAHGNVVVLDWPNMRKLEDVE